MSLGDFDSSCEKEKQVRRACVGGWVYRPYYGYRVYTDPEKSFQQPYCELYCELYCNLCRLPEEIPQLCPDLWGGQM